MATDSKNNSLRSQDPYLARELEKYGRAIPSREYILDILQQEGVPLAPAALIALLDITPDEEEWFTRRVRAMVREGQIFINRKGAICLATKLDLVPGRVVAHPDGFGFVVPDAGGDDIFLGPRAMHLVLHGDRVMVRPTGYDRRGRPEGIVVEVLERANRNLVGRLYLEHGVHYVVAEDPRISQDVLVAPGDLGGASPGQVVVVEIVEQPTQRSNPIGRVVEVVGLPTDSGIEIEIALRKHHLPHLFTPQAIQQAEAYGPEVRLADSAAREDLRALPLVTIDGETAKDFDDAVFCEQVPDGWRLVVAIADVSHYVQPGDPLDVEAVERGTSVYFPRRVIPMLPEALSNGLCSLNPQVDRLCMVCDMVVGTSGEIQRYRFYPAVMNSHARLTYNRVAAAIFEQPATVDAEISPLLPHLIQLKAVFGALLAARQRRGAIDFETTETQIQFTDEGRIAQIVPVTRNDAHRLIEECMLAANVCAAKFLLENEQPCLFRIHESPSPEKLENLRAFLKEFGLGLEGGEKPHARDYGRLLEQIRVRPDAALLQTVMLRSMQQAVYSPGNVGHFGLAYDAYTHFTSPIRRYPDLLVHRAIKAVLLKQRYQPRMAWDSLGAHCSLTERRADEAGRDVTQQLKCFYMLDKVNEEFEGTISAVTSFGLFVLLDGIFIEGLVHISELGNDYYKFDAQKHRLLGERTGHSYRLGDRLRIRVVRVDLDTAKIDFVLGSGDNAAR